MKILSTMFLILFSFNALASVNKIVLFGDSLSDNGNLYEYMKHQIPQSPPYYKGRFTNGRVWIEMLARSFFPEETKSHFTDYAFGGAGVLTDDKDDSSFFTLHTEVDSYLLAHDDKADPESLFIVWIGANNYLGLPEPLSEAVLSVNEGIYKELQRLAEKGATHVLILNLPDLGKIPAAKEFDAVDYLTKASVEHNLALDKKLADLKSEFPNTRWMLMNVYNMFDDMYKHKEKYGFSNVKDTCYESLAEVPSKHTMIKMASSIKMTKLANMCEGYLFFDPVHPTYNAHKVFASKTKELIKILGIEMGS